MPPPSRPTAGSKWPASATSTRARLDAAAAKLGIPAKATDARELAMRAAARRVLLLHPAHRARRHGPAGHRKRRAADRHGEAGRADQRGGHSRSATCWRPSGVKAVVSHQHRYGEHYRKVKEIIASGALGRVHTVYGTATGWMMHMLSHLIDYMRWYNGEAPAEWVMAQAAGRGKLARPASLARLHRRLHPVCQRRARRGRMRRRRAGRARSGLLVAQMPHRRAGHRRLRRSADRRRLARGDQRAAPPPAAAA